jgi:hypothetical protein
LTVETIIAEVRQAADLRKRNPLTFAGIEDSAAVALELLKKAPADLYVPFVLEALRIAREETTFASAALASAAGTILRRKLSFTEEQARRLVETVAVPRSSFPYRGVLKVAESVPMSPDLAEALRQLRPCITEYLGGPEMKALHERIDRLLAIADGAPTVPALAPQGPWSEAVFQEARGSAEWMAVFQHVAELKQSEPSNKWRARARELILTLGKGRFDQAATRWLQLGPSPSQPGVQLSSKESDYEKGFLWLLPDSADPEVCRLIARFAESSLKKIPMIGAVSQKVGNACVNVLAAMDGLEPVTQLSGLAQRIKYDTAQRLIRQALERAAQRAGVSRDQLEEMTAPDCGLGPDGSRAQQFGDYVAHLAIENTTGACLTWTDTEGNQLTSVPAAVKQQHPEELKAVKSAAKEMERMLDAHRTRVERLLLTQRAIPLESWRAYYIDHPLLCEMARRLIWQFESPAGRKLGIWRSGRMVGLNGDEIELPVETLVRLWHPISSDIQTIFNWRCWLEDHQTTQPFKQAHREVYLLTDAERQTSHYTNRFAGHILRQHQFQALCRQRGWSFRLMGPFDSHNTPTLELPKWGLQAEFHVDFPADERATQHAIYIYIRTDRVCFRNPQLAEVGLESIPSILFSEIMRDVDLFVGVTSVMNDPRWGIENAQTPIHAYWRTASFDELSASAKNRREVLERLLPKLEIRERCRLEDRFLIVRGDRATYKIHLGSGNVLVEPGSRYLCIVPARGPLRLFLPFEGDETLTVILSKMFLLADDTNIKDPAIVSQLRAAWAR